jgi:Uri superfamily endonuclease
MPRSRRIAIGKLGHFVFSAGYYIYTGSAKRGLEPRVRRHLGKEKKLRWYVDYLLRRARVVEVKRYRGGRLSECVLSRKVERLPGSDVIAPGFGSSDCRCPTHLFHFLRNPARELG